MSFVVALFLICSCSHETPNYRLLKYDLDDSLNERISTNKETITKLENLKSVYKFGPEKGGSFKFPHGYVGILPKSVRPLANQRLNESIEGIINLIQKNPNPTKEQILIEFSIGLYMLYNIAVDTEDRERVCIYYTDIMDIIGLDSSNELLNNWLYNYSLNTLEN